MDEKYRAKRLTLGFGKDVGVSCSIELSGFVLDSRVIWGDFVDHVMLIELWGISGEGCLEDKAKTSFEVG
jgi:hypothetical protein